MGRNARHHTSCFYAHFIAFADETAKNAMYACELKGLSFEAHSLFCNFVLR